MKTLLKSIFWLLFFILNIIKVLLRIVLVMTTVGIFIVLLLPDRYKSYIIMNIYSSISMKNSVLKRENIDIYISGGNITKEYDWLEEFGKNSINKLDENTKKEYGWYPYVLIYNSDKGFSSYTKKDLELTILYNFGKFNEGHSTLYDKDSPYYCGFYGGYIVKSNDEPFGYKDGKVDIDELALIGKYDYTHLVIGGFNCPLAKNIYEYDVKNVVYDVDYAGIEGWTLIDSEVNATGTMHNFKKYIFPYIQYGYPKEKVKNEFEIVKLYTRVYTKYIKDKNVSIVLYIQAANKQVLIDCDKYILSKTSIKL